MKSTPWGNKGWLRVAAVVATLFGLLTIREGGAVIFVDGAGRQAAGDYVSFVVWFNFLAGFVYFISGIGLWFRRPWAARLALGIVVATVIVFAAFGLHVLNGGAYENRTLVAMSLRSIIWIAIAATSYLALIKNTPQTSIGVGGN